MFGSAIIVFRETLEAALIIGIIAAATQGLPARNRWLLGGIAVGIVGSLAVAGLTEQIAEAAEGFGQEIFNAAVLGLAALMLAWHNIWMARHGMQLAREARQLGQAVVAGGREMSAVGVVITLAILREGAETCLFLYGLLSGGEHSLASIAGGGLLGLAAGALAGYGLYAGFLRIPMRWFFAATSGLVLLLAAAMASQMARYLVDADYLPSLAAPLWDTSWILSNGSALGSVLHTLIGYEAAPMGIQVIFYAATVTLIAAGMRALRPAPAKA